MTSDLIPEWRRSAYFPRLTDTNHRVTSPQDADYNCVAWAVNDVTARWWPDTEPEYYWLEGVRNDDSLASFRELFAQFGYEVCESAELEADYEKVAVYADADGPTHVARQVESGQWTSKLGLTEDIEHQTLEDLHSDNYGQVSLLMRKRREQEN